MNPPFAAAKKMYQGCYPNPYFLPFYQQKDLSALHKQHTFLGFYR